VLPLVHPACRGPSAGPWRDPDANGRMTTSSAPTSRGAPVPPTLPCRAGRRQCGHLRRATASVGVPRTPETLRHLPRGRSRTLPRRTRALPPAKLSETAAAPSAVPLGRTNVASRRNRWSAASAFMSGRAGRCGSLPRARAPGAGAWPASARRPPTEPLRWRRFARCVDPRCHPAARTARDPELSCTRRNIACTPIRRDYAPSGIAGNSPVRADVL
jgi:hypothetical protein